MTRRAIWLWARGQVWETLAVRTDPWEVGFGEGVGAAERRVLAARWRARHEEMEGAWCFVAGLDSGTGRVVLEAAAAGAFTAGRERDAPWAAPPPPTEASPGREEGAAGEERVALVYATGDALEHVHTAVCTWSGEEAGRVETLGEAAIAGLRAIGRRYELLGGLSLDEPRVVLTAAELGEHAIRCARTAQTLPFDVLDD